MSRTNAPTWDEEEAEEGAETRRTRGGKEKTDFGDSDGDSDASASDKHVAPGRLSTCSRPFGTTTHSPVALWDDSCLVENALSY